MARGKHNLNVNNARTKKHQNPIKITKSKKIGCCKRSLNSNSTKQKVDTSFSDGHTVYNFDTESDFIRLMDGKENKLICAKEVVDDAKAMVEMNFKMLNEASLGLEFPSPEMLDDQYMRCLKEVVSLSKNNLKIEEISLIQAEENVRRAKEVVEMHSKMLDEIELPETMRDLITLIKESGPLLKEYFINSENSLIQAKENVNYAKAFLERNTKSLYDELRRTSELTLKTDGNRAKGLDLN